MTYVKFKLVAPAGQARSAPPLGPVLGQYQINIVNFCKDFNTGSLKFEEGIPLRVVVTRFENKSYELLIKKASLTFLLKQFLLKNNTLHLKTISVAKLFDLVRLDFEFSTVANFVSHTLSVLGCFSVMKLKIVN